MSLSENEEVRPAQAKSDCTDLFVDLPTLKEMNARYLQYVLEKTQGRIAGPGGAAEILGVKRSTLYEKLRKYGLK